VKRIACLFGCLTSLAMSAPAIAQACAGTPSAETLESAAKITQLLDNGLVQFGGYLAMVSYAQSRDDCVKAGVFEDLYVSAVEAMPNTQMRVWKDWSVSPLDIKLDAATRMDGFGGSCRITFDLPQVGTPENVRVSCDNPMLKSTYRSAWKKLIFAPVSVGQGFSKGEDLEIEIDLNRRIDEWVF